MASPLEADQRNSPLALRSKQPPVSQRHSAKDRRHMRSQRLMLAVCVFGESKDQSRIDEWIWNAEQLLIHRLRSGRIYQ